MSAISGSPLAPPARLHWTRARATHIWMLGFGAVAATRFVLLAALPAFTSVTLGEIGDDLLRALLFPALFLVTVGFCERRFLRRPPKAMLAAQLAFFCAGSVLHALSLLGKPELAAAASIVLSGSTLLLGAWFVGVLLVPED